MMTIVSLPSIRQLSLALAAGVVLAAPPAHAASDTTRVIVAFKPGAQGPARAAVAAARGSIKHEIYGMDAMAIEVPLGVFDLCARQKMNARRQD